jgi:hypothetical protein
MIYKINNIDYVYESQVFKSINNRIDKYVIVDVINKKVLEGWPTYNQAYHFCTVVNEHSINHNLNEKFEVYDNPLFNKK